MKSNTVFLHHTLLYTSLTYKALRAIICVYDVYNKKNMHKEVVSIRVSKEVKATLAEVAKAKGMSLSAYLSEEVSGMVRSETADLILKGLDAEEFLLYADRIEKPLVLSKGCLWLLARSSNGYTKYLRKLKDVSQDKYEMAVAGHRDLASLR